MRALVHHHVRLFQEQPDLMRVLLQNRGAAAPESARSLQRAVQEWTLQAGLPAQPGPQLLALWLGPVLELGRLAPAQLPACADRLAQAAWIAVGPG